MQNSHTGVWNSFSGTSVQANFQNVISQHCIGESNTRVWDGHPELLYSLQGTLICLFPIIIDCLNLSHTQHSRDTACSSSSHQPPGW